MLIDDLISIIVPVYNVEKYLRQCLDSIINQTYKNLEIVLVDDGSLDNCGKICDEYAQKDKRIKVIHKENGGLSSARNAGLDIANGEYISFVDSDDLISENFIEALYQNSKIYDSDISQCFYTREFEKLGEKTNLFENSVVSNIEAVKILNNTNLHNFFVIACSKLYRKNLFENVRFPLKKISEDTFVTYLLYYQSNKVSIMNSMLYYYRQNPSSIMNKKFYIERLNALEGYEQEINFFKNKDRDCFVSSCVLYEEKIRLYYRKVYESDIEDRKEINKEILKKGRRNLVNSLKGKCNLGMKLKFIIFSCFPNMYIRFIVKPLDFIKNMISSIK